MKMIASLILFILFSIGLYATTYYVDYSTGNNTNNGRTVLSPWKTLNKVNKTKFMPGDSILLKRGEFWREQLIPHSGDSTGYITYSCYGKSTRKKPLILGSISRNNPGDWKNTGGNIWSTVALKADIGNIIFNKGKSCGFKVWKESDLDIQGKFWHDADNAVVKLYSKNNPAKYYKDIELAVKCHIIDQNNKSYVKYDNLELRNGAAHGIGGGSVHHIMILNCDLSFIGGALQYYKPNGDPVRYGNGIEFWGNAHDCYVIGCKIGEVYDAALTNQGKDSVAQYHIYYRNNIIWNSEYSFEYWLGNQSTISLIYIENNTCINAGKGFGHNQRPDGPNGRHLMFYSNKSKLDNFYIRNNIFYESTESAIRLGASWNDLANVKMDFNLYYESGSNVVDWQGKTYSYQKFANFQKDTGKDSSSIFANPNFKNVSKLDLRIQHHSPAYKK
jgi:hypothetical protein